MLVVVIVDAGTPGGGGIVAAGTAPAGDVTGGPSYHLESAT